MIKVGDKKESRTASVNINWVSLQVLWNAFLKFVTESAFSKTSGLSSKQHRQQDSAGLLQETEHTSTHSKN